MGMTLEEAIKDAEEVSNKCQNFVTAHNKDRELDFIQRTEKCAADHRQLAAWLRELQERRKQPEIIRCGECRYSNKKYSGEMFCEICNGFGIDENSFCSFAERRTDEQG